MNMKCEKASNLNELIIGRCSIWKYLTILSFYDKKVHNVSSPTLKSSSDTPSSPASSDVLAGMPNISADARGSLDMWKIEKIGAILVYLNQCTIEAGRIYVRKNGNSAWLKRRKVKPLICMGKK